MFADLPPHSRVAGIGSRQLTLEELATCRKLGREIAEAGHVLVSGAADGADRAFMDGAAEAGGEIVVYLPWTYYQRRYLPKNCQVVVLDADTRKWWSGVAAQFHPAWDKCAEAAQKLLTRNVGIVVGEEHTIRTQLVLAFPSTLSRGGTMHAMRVAEAFGVPVINLRK